MTTSGDEAVPTKEMSPTTSAAAPQTHKRKASNAGLDGAVPTRPVKRRASKACQCCRARKVRCNVTEHGAPCTNCRLDEVECIVSESRRKKKWNKDGDAQFTQSKTSPGVLQNSATSNAASADSSKVMGRKLASRGSIPFAQTPLAQSHELDSPVDSSSHVPHSIYQTTGQRLSLNFQGLAKLPFSPTSPSSYPILQPSPLSIESHYFSTTPRVPSVANLQNLPYFIKPLPGRIGPDEAAYLEKKGALTVPSETLRNELLRAYIEFVHPYMPLLDLYEFIMIIESGNGALGRISLILYQAVMFAGSAFVDMSHLYNAGYASRKQARKDFFNKTRLLYDFDYESDRVSLVQALLLLTYYYETPDDQKDTWHWMGVATSVAHTIGLHRNPDRSNMDAKRTKLWKRIWWSTYMRDRLIALGMRRPTRIKAEDYDVPMITLDDFELVAIPDSVKCVPADCLVARDVEKQRQVAIMCIEKAKLCLCISHVLAKQYCVLNNNQGMVNDRTTMMLLPKKLDPETSEVKACDQELQAWFEALAPEAQHRDTVTGDACVDLSRALLHLVFYTTLSALHRPQVLPSTPMTAPQTAATLDLLEVSRTNVRRAAGAITSIAQILDSNNLVKFLPTTGVTVLLPAIIIHLLDIKAPEEDIRRRSLRGFCHCMTVMGKLRDMYAAADYSTAFLEAAIRKAGIQVSTFNPKSKGNPKEAQMHPVMTVEDLVDAGRRLDMATMPPPPANTMTPPPDMGNHALFVADLKDSPSSQVTDEEVASQLKSFLASTPESDHSSDAATLHDTISSALDTASIAPTTSGATLLGDHDLFNSNFHGKVADADYKLLSSIVMPQFEQDDFDALLNLDAMAENGTWAFDDGGTHGFTEDMNWLQGTPGQKHTPGRIQPPADTGLDFIV